MVEIVCTCPELARNLKESVQWKLLVLYLERRGVSASIWVEGEEAPAFAQIPGFTRSAEAKISKPKVKAVAQPVPELEAPAEEKRF
ncbi:MAG: hypothetical protein ICV62_08270 [Cyanobacteria bacterium Co-bin13]|nr:hypothetical protein [Cyanobacteria bacterium Co-bin13]